MTLTTLLVIAVFFYPILPLLAYIRMMWMRRDTRKSVNHRHGKIEKAPDASDRKDSIPIPDDDSLAKLIPAIAGGIEAPIQFILQV